MSFGEEDPDDGLSFTARIEKFRKLDEERKRRRLSPIPDVDMGVDP
jgi:hypothetical protein